ncbi:MAG TPA: hypothetical protein DD381_10840 [Lentisphaeria bacterium]|nr:MAG: hypothetical protein A2X47_00760 [Lentisphaerae bacterium GWF2_38_69]HBM16823.1 hypothetical protein [Lentisphaeria bacterium]
MSIALPLDRMTVVEKLQAMETIWNDLCRKSENIPSPAWHEDVLSKREQNVRNGTDSFTDWETAKKDIRKSVS